MFDHFVGLALKRLIVAVAVVVRKDFFRKMKHFPQKGISITGIILGILRSFHSVFCCFGIDSVEYLCATAVRQVVGVL